MSNDLHERIQTAIIEGDDQAAAQIAQEIVEEPSGAIEAVDSAIQAIRLVGDRFGEGEIFLPEMILAAEAMTAFTEGVASAIEEVGGEARTYGTVVLGTVKGDIHTIGKDITGTMLSASGFEVRDVGVDVPPMDVIQTAEQMGADIIGLSALMTTSMPYQKEVIDLLDALDSRDDFWVIVGGGPLTPEYAESIGANGWARSAAGAVSLCERLLASEDTPSTAEFIAEEK
jgi:trimethylamine corrinoid protein